MQGSALRQARRERGWTQEELARRLEVSQGYVSLMENDLRRVPERLLPTLRKLLPLSPTELPPDEEPARLEAGKVAQYLAGLGYPRFAYVRSAEPLNPAQLDTWRSCRPDGPDHAGQGLEDSAGQGSGGVGRLVTPGGRDGLQPINQPFAGGRSR